MREMVDRQSGTFRIGVMFTAASALMAAMAINVPSGDLLLMVPLVVVGATGLGLLLGARFARVLGGVLFVAGLVASPLSLASALVGSLRLAGRWELSLVLSLANGIATTVLLMWLCFRGLQVMRGKTMRAGVFTARLTGVVVALVAVHHLWVAVQAGASSLAVGSFASFSLRVGALGTTLSGFPGWPLWHLAALVLAGVLVAGPRRALVGAASALTVLFVCLVPLVLLAVARANVGELWLSTVVLSLVLLLAALAWWLRDELRGVRPAQLAAGDTP